MNYFLDGIQKFFLAIDSKVIEWQSVAEERKHEAPRFNVGYEKSRKLKPCKGRKSCRIYYCSFELFIAEFSKISFKTVSAGRITQPISPSEL